MKKILITLSIFLLTACTNSNVDTAPHSIGNENAPILIEEFSDPECPACGVISPQIEEFARNNTELVRLEYYHFPLSYHEHAFIAAEAAECAGDQNKFWEYLGTTFKNQESLSEDYLYNIADSLELDRTLFDTCLDNHDKKAKIVAHQREGRIRNLPGTPTLYVNGQLVKFGGIEQFEAYIKSLSN